ncbi:MAG: hypothetical protein U0525_05975 [Patescibacteria group bacterium]
MSIFSSLFSKSSKKPKKDYVGILFLLEQKLGISVYERLPDRLIPVDSKFTKADTSNYEEIGDTIEKLLNPIEKNLSNTVKNVLFVIPSYATSDPDGSVIAPFRGFIKSVVKDFEFTALGYIDTFEIVKTLESQNPSWIFLERGAQSADLILCSHEEIRKKLKITSDADEICAHIEESATKKAKIVFFSSMNHEDDLTFERNLVGYTWIKMDLDEVSDGAYKLLTSQLIETKTPEDQTDEHQMQEVNTDQDIQVSHMAEDVVAVGVAKDVIPEENKVAPSLPITEEVKIDEFLNNPNPSMAAAQETVPVTSETALPQTHEELDFDDFVVYDENAKPDVALDKALDSREKPEIKSSVSAHDSTKLRVQKEEEFVPAPVLVEEKAKRSNVEDSTKESMETGGEDEKVKNNGNNILGSLASLVVPSILALFLALFAGTLIFLHKAHVVVVVDTEDFKTDVTLKNFAINKIQDTKDISAETSATGSKEIGERSKGQVVIASFDDKVASFSAGTKLTTSNDKVFRLDADVSLDPASVNTAEGTKVASKKSAKASATFIGPEGNIDKGVDMAVSDYSKALYYAVAESAFTGGMKQSVAAISNADIKELDNKLQKISDSNLVDIQKKKLSDNEIVLQSLSKSVVDDVEYSAGVGDAKTDISATAKGSYTIYYGQKNIIAKELAGAVKSKLGDKYAFDINNISMEVKKTNIQKDEKHADLTVSAEIHPYIPPKIDEVRSKLVFGIVSSLEEKLGGDVKLVNIRVNPSLNFPPFSLFMPVMKENISVSVIPSGSDK